MTFTLSSYASGAAFLLLRALSEAYIQFLRCRTNLEPEPSLRAPSPNIQWMARKKRHPRRRVYRSSNSCRSHGGLVDPILEPSHVCPAGPGRSDVIQHNHAVQHVKVKIVSVSTEMKLSAQGTLQYLLLAILFLLPFPNCLRYDIWQQIQHTALAIAHHSDTSSGPPSNILLNCSEARRRPQLSSSL